LARGRVSWTEEATGDLESIREFIGRDSPRYAALTVERLVRAVDILEDHPEAGRIVPEFGQRDLKELIRGSYRIVYRLQGDAAQILTVFRASRQIPQDIQP
jgi:toxin ParE1/3/4